MHAFFDRSRMAAGLVLLLATHGAAGQHVDVTAPDPRAVHLVELLRGGRLSKFRQAVDADPALANVRGPRGATVLMHAALYGDASTVEWLLTRGADPNRRGDRRETALMWAVPDLAKVRLLVERGADVNARADGGTTVLGLAAGLADGTAIVRYLLDHGAAAGQALSSGDSPAMTSPVPLARAAAAGALDTMRLLVERGARPADVGHAALVDAATSGCLPCVELIARNLPPFELGRALGQFVHLRGDSSMAALLQVRGVLPVAPAAATPTGFVLGNSLRVAVRRSLSALQRPLVPPHDCGPCDADVVAAMAIASVRAAGLRVDDVQVSRQRTDLVARARRWPLEGLDGLVASDAPLGAAALLVRLQAHGYASDPMTDSLARSVHLAQTFDGRWRARGSCSSQSPCGNDAAATALSIRALRLYGIEAFRAEFDASIALGADWLAQSPASTDEERALRLLGLAWAGVRRDAMRAAMRDLAAHQREDGGWSDDLDGMTSAYATGLALAALHEAGMRTADGVSRRGVDYLLKTQLSDGSWHARSRWPFVTAACRFPHGRDADLSLAATGWATLALAAALPSDETPTARRWE